MRELNDHFAAFPTYVYATFRCPDENGVLIYDFEIFHADTLPDPAPIPPPANNGDFAVTLGELQFNASGATDSFRTGTFAATLSELQFAASGAIRPNRVATMKATLSELQFAASGAISPNRVATMKATLSELQFAASGAISPNRVATMKATLSELQFAASGSVSSTVSSPLIFDKSGDFSFVVPGGVTSMHIRIWGTGAGDYLGGGGGGGGGGYGEVDLVVTPGNLFHVHISDDPGGLSAFTNYAGTTEDGYFSVGNGQASNGLGGSPGGPGGVGNADGLVDGGPYSGLLFHNGGAGAVGSGPGTPAGGGGCAGSTGDGGDAVLGVGGVAGTGTGPAGAGGNTDQAGNAVGGGGGANVTVAHVGAVGNTWISW